MHMSWCCICWLEVLYYLLKAVESAVPNELLPSCKVIRLQHIDASKTRMLCAILRVDRYNA